jgi:ADP-ribose pyrophosphatase YjhB (NUDIX family)
MPTDSTRVFIDGALFSGESKLLLLRRLDGVWELPSGPLEFGEEPEYGVARIVVELTGIDVTPDRPIGAWSLLDVAAETRVHAVHIGFTVTLAGTLLGVELDIEKHATFAWLNQNELAARIDSPPMLRACERAFAALARPRKNK